MSISLLKRFLNKQRNKNTKPSKVSWCDWIDKWWRWYPFDVFSMSIEENICNNVLKSLSCPNVSCLPASALISFYSKTKEMLSGNYFVREPIVLSDCLYIRFDDEGINSTRAWICAHFILWWYWLCAREKLIPEMWRNNVFTLALKMLILSLVHL